MSHNGEYYLIGDEALLQSIEKNEIELSKLEMIIEPHSGLFAKSAKGEFQTLLLNYSLKLTTLLQLDDTEVYQIGNKLFALRKIRYAYRDDLELRYLCEIEDTLASFPKEKLRLFIFTYELLPTSPEISMYLYKRKYDFPMFWHYEVIKYINEFR